LSNARLDKMTVVIKSFWSTTTSYYNRL